MCNFPIIPGAIPTALIPPDPFGPALRNILQSMAPPNLLSNVLRSLTPPPNLLADLIRSLTPQRDFSVADYYARSQVQMELLATVYAEWPDSDVESKSESERRIGFGSEPEPKSDPLPLPTHRIGFRDGD